MIIGLMWEDFFNRKKIMNRKIWLFFLLFSSGSAVEKNKEKVNEAGKAGMLA